MKIDRQTLINLAIRIIKYRDNSLNELCKISDVSLTSLRKPINPKEGEASDEILMKIIEGLTGEIHEISEDIKSLERLNVTSFLAKNLKVNQLTEANLQEDISPIFLDLSFKIMNDSYVLFVAGDCVVTTDSVDKETRDTPEMANSDYYLEIINISLYKDEVEIKDYTQVVCKEWVEQVVNKYCVG